MSEAKTLFARIINGTHDIRAILVKVEGKIKQTNMSFYSDKIDYDLTEN